MNINDIGKINIESNNLLTGTLKEKTEQGKFREILQSRISVLSKPGRGHEKKDNKLMELCYQMESILVGKMLKTMRNTVHKNEFIHGGFAEEIFEDMLYDEYALNLSRKENLGIAAMLYDDLSKL